MPLPVRLLLFGSGPEIEPIAQLAANLGWVVERFGHPSAEGMADQMGVKQKCVSRF
jgi:hypothetical protein